MYSAFILSTTDNDGVAFTSRRSPVYSTHGMVACSQPLAAQAGLRILQAGGNAADAAVAVAAALSVTEPCTTGPGGDAFALFYCAASRKVSCLSGNGAAPAGLTLEAVRAAGITGSELPADSPLCVTVPGAVALWESALQAWGSQPMADVLLPAIELAEQGFPVHPIAAYDWAKGAALIARQGGPGARALVDEHGAAPRAGQVWRNPDLAATLRRVAEHGAAKGFYTGPVAEAIAEALASRGGVMTAQDLADHKTLALDPISTEYRGHVVWEVPPPTAGVVTLMALNILKAHQQQQEQEQPGGSSSSSSDSRWSPEQLHASIEACRMAFADALACVADPLVHESLPLAEMLSQQRAAARYSQYFDAARACQPVPCEQLAAAGTCKKEQGGDTCQWVVVDSQGNAASFIQSNYRGFGTGIVPRGCGFSLQNRGHGFNLDPGHPNSLAPRKRPYHTIMPGMLTDEHGNLVSAFGCMGGYMQPQAHLQLVLNLLDHGLDAQAALDAPRWYIDRLDSAVGPASVAASHLLLEDGTTAEVVAALQAKGHDVRVVTGRARAIFGKGAIITRRVEGTQALLCGGSDGRGDGAVAAW